MLHIIEKEADITPQRHIEQAPIVPQVGIMFEVGIDIVADLSERLIDVFDVVVCFQREDRVGIQLPLVDAADNGAPIESTLRELWGVAGLPMIERELLPASNGWARGHPANW